MSSRWINGVRRGFGHVFHPYPARSVPAGTMVNLPGRGATYVTDSGPANAPAVFLLHSVMTTGLLCWYPVIPELNQRYRVITMDQRWHGRGIRSDGFSLDECADDVVALADVLGIDRFIAAGFSMGGGIAQLVWRRHAERVAGLVLCSTGPYFSTRNPELREQSHRTGRLLTSLKWLLPTSRPGRLDDTSAHTSVWAMRQFFSTALWQSGQFGDGLGAFDSRPWLDQIDVPTSVVVSVRDKVVEPERQQLLVDGIPGARRFEVDGGHACCVLAAQFFIPPFIEAIDSVAAVAAGPRQH